MKSVFAYVRVSTVKQGQRGSSLQEQRSSIEAYASRYQLSITEWFEELETAAKRGRQVFNRMLALLESHRADGVIIHKIDRGARNLRDWADLGELIDRGIAVHFAHESLDLHSRGGRLSADIQAVVAADYIRNLREEVRKGFVGRLKQGFYPLPAPIGYQDQGKAKPKLQDPATAPLIRKAFELYASGGYSLDSLSEELFRLGLRTRSGGRVCRTSLSKILNNEFYVGMIRIKRTGETYQGVHEPIVSTALFSRVQEMLQGRTQNTGYKHTYTYRRMLHCACCGYSLTAERQKGHVYYRCHKKSCPKTCVREETVDEQVQSGLRTIKLYPDELSLIDGEIKTFVDNSSDTRARDIKTMSLQLAQIDDRLTRLTDAYIDRVIERELFEQRKGTLLHDRAAIQERLRDREAGLDPAVGKAKEIFELLSAISGNADFTNPDERRDFVKEATSNLLVDQNRVVFAWRPPFQLLASRVSNDDGAPQRDRLRTKRLAKELCKSIVEESAYSGFTSPRPQVHPNLPTL